MRKLVTEAVSGNDKARILKAIDIWNSWDWDLPTIYPKSEDLPVPSDPTITYDESTGIITFEGEILPGGPGYGRAIMEIPIDHFLECFDIDYLDQ